MVLGRGLPLAGIDPEWLGRPAKFVESGLSFPPVIGLSGRKTGCSDGDLTVRRTDRGALLELPFLLGLEDKVSDFLAFGWSNVHRLIAEFPLQWCQSTVQL